MLDWDELYFDTMDWIYHFFYIQIGFHALKNAEPGERLFADMDNFDQCYDRFNPIHRMFVGAGIVIHHLRDFGFWEYERAYRKKPYSSERDIDVKAVTPTWLGVAMINACIKRPLEVYNPYLDQKRIRDMWSTGHIRPVLEKLTLNTPKLVKKVEPFELVFKDIFPDEAIDMKGLEILLSDQKEASGEAQPNVYLFKVSLGHGCWRTIKLSTAHSLQHLHDSIQKAFGFWDDHLFAFFMDGKPWSRDVYWDKREGSKPTADKVMIGKLGLSAGKQFLYLFDFGDEWRFTVKVEKFVHEITPFKPVIVERLGDNPEQYPEWEE
ncbi:MAG: plasmid pRiA4b ORF-3 family protein [Firmicutes bacterium]|nr:plasmid pRiA4b ORF-3 family protein [Bacillota bacterium]